MEIVSYLSSRVEASEKQIRAALSLFAEGASVPFIARYKKEETGGLSDIALRTLEEEKEKFEKLSERKETVLKSISEQGKLTDELKEQIENCDSLSLLETIYRPYRPKRKTRGSVAKEKGLGPLADFVKRQEGNLESLKRCAYTFVNPEKGVNNVDEAIAGALDILAEEIGDNPSFYLLGKGYIYKTGKIKAKETKEDTDKKYANYDNFLTPVSRIKSYQTLALLRGKKEKKLTFSFAYDELTIINHIAREVIKRNCQYSDLLKDMITDAYKRLLAPSIENEIVGELFDKAQDSSLALFRKNLMQLLLGAPLKGKKILGFDPGYRNGCKLALIDMNGKVLSSCIIYPTIGKEKEAERTLLSLYKEYGYEAIALGNGTASRESEAFLKKFLSSNGLENVSLTIVNESGASVYSASPLAIKEFPNMDIEERSAVSLARRLLDPMAELVKIPPESIGVGQYQHDMDETRLKETLKAASIDAVNEVGVWLNTASISLLKYVSGLNEKVATSIVTYRDEHGSFASREELKKVKGLGEKTYRDAAGFLRVNNDNPLERSAVHPKDYEATYALLKELGVALNEVGSEKANTALSSLKDIAGTAKRLGIGEYTLSDIIEELKKPGRDPRDSSVSAVLDNKVTSIDDLSVGMMMNGTVRNLADFGAFVDIGVHNDGLVHISEIADHFIHHPSEELSLGEIVKVKVIGVDKERKRISLSIKQAKE